MVYPLPPPARIGHGSFLESFIAKFCPRGSKVEDLNFVNFLFLLSLKILVGKGLLEMFTIYLAGWGAVGSIKVHFGFTDNSVQVVVNRSTFDFVQVAANF